MRSSGSSPRPNTQPSTQYRQPLFNRPISSSPSQQSCLDFALQTLDNTHTLWLLQSLPLVQPHLLCLRTRLAHQLNQHHRCLQFCLESLQLNPSCPDCLDVYLAHARESSQSCLIRPRLISALSDEGSPRALHYVLKLAEVGQGATRYRELMAELRNQRGQLEKFQILQIKANERKIVAKSHIRRDELILFVPKHKLITLELARALPLVDRLYGMRVHLKSPKHTQLAVFLLYQFEKGEGSHFYNYLTTLPTDFNRFPVNYSSQLLQELRGTNFLQQVQTKKLDMRKDYEVVCSVDETFSRFSYQKFAEARLLVCSRVFGVVIDRVKTDALVPVADMLNHHMPKQTSWYYCDYSKGFVIQSLKEINPGAEIFDSYGQKCNSRFLLNYGFTLPDNQHNEISLTITSTARRSTFARLKVTRILESKAFEGLIGVLRVAANPQVPPDSDEQSEPLENAKTTPFSSIQQEVRAWQLLERIITDRLREYPTSLAQDRRLLERAEGSLADVITLRIGEKEVLHFYQTMARKMGRFLGTRSKRSEVAAYESYLSGLQLDGRTQQ